MKSITFLTIFTLFSTVLFSQQTTQVAFDTYAHDFGDIQEENGPTSFDFKFTNIGKETYIIREVKASCGCTTPAYSEEPVKPGKTGFVRATYDPTNLRGSFDKTITVSGNTKGDITLTIKGNVIPRPHSVLDDYPAVMGSLRFKVNNVVLGEVFQNTIDTGYIEVFNPGKTAVIIERIQVPDHIRTEYMPITIKPGEKRKIEVYFSAFVKQDLGYGFDRIQMKTDDPLMPEKEFIVVANIVLNKKIMTDEELKNAGKIDFEKTEVDFGNVNHGDIKETEFKFKNIGNNQLVIYDTKTNCGCTATTLGQMRYEKGQEGTIKVSFNTKGKSGAVQQSVTVISNDPNSPEVYLLIKANVQKIN